MGYLSDRLSPNSVWAQALNRPPSGPMRRMAADDPRQGALGASMNAKNESLLDLYSVLLNERGADGERPLGPSALEQMQTLNEMTPYDPDSADMMAGLPDALEYMMDSSLMPGPGVMAGTVGRAGGVADALSGVADDAARVADDVPIAGVRNQTVTPELGQPFDDWIDGVYANSGPDNKFVLDDVHYRGMSDAEYDMAMSEGAFRANGAGVFAEPSPDRYVGGGAYGARNGGYIVEMDTAGLSRAEGLRGGAGTGDYGFDEIPTSNVRRVWKWDNDSGTHVLVQDNVNDAARVADDLPMDEVSRMARADDMWPGDGYHGTNKSFDEFSVSSIDGQRSGSDLGVHIGTKGQANEIVEYGPTAQRTTGDQYAENSNVMPLRLKEGNYLELEDPLTQEWGVNGVLTQLAWKKTPEFPNGIELTFKDPFKPTLIEVREGLQELGFDGISYKNLVEGGGADNSLIVFDPSHIRSRFAKFDPRNINSRDLLASGIGGGALGYGLLGNNDAEASQ